MAKTDNRSGYSSHELEQTIKEAGVKQTNLSTPLVKGDPVTARCCETRIWQKLDGNWKQVHVHRS